MTILVTGATGQLGRELVQMLKAVGEKVIGVSRKELDFSKPDSVAERIAAYNAQWVVNCAAYTQVDKAEAERDLAFRINRDSAAAVAEGVKRCGGRMLHVSTDFIFDGEQSQAYTEDDAANPLSVYGQSKWEGEQAVNETLPGSTIVRTAWVYGAHGNNFVKSILRLAAQQKELRVVDDQFGTPSWTADIAGAIRTLIEANAAGTFHFTNEGVASRCEFAERIVFSARSLGFPVAATAVRPISSSDFPTAATRPRHCVLAKQKIRKLLHLDIPHWQRSLESMLKQSRASVG